MSTTANLKVWAALLVAAVSAAIAVAIGVASLAGTAQAATPTRATIEATQFTVGGDDTAEAFAKCPSGKRAVGGGVVQSGSALGPFVRASGPLDNTGVTANTITGDIAKQWYAAVLNGGDTERTLRVFAICSGTSTAKIKATPFDVQSGQDGEAFAKCATTKRALGGGVVQSGSASDLLVKASGPLDNTGVTLETKDGDKAKQWYAAVRNQGTTERTLRVFAICE